MNNDYKAYLVRFMRRNGHWRATLQDVNNNEPVSFATEQELLHYIMKTLTTNDSFEQTDWAHALLGEI